MLLHLLPVLWVHLDLKALCENAENLQQKTDLVNLSGVLSFDTERLSSVPLSKILDRNVGE